MQTRASELLATAAGGRAQALVIRGDLGMGKTKLLDDVRAVAIDDKYAEVLETCGVEADAELGFASLLTLLRPLGRELDELAGVFADDVRVALTLGTRRPTDDGRVRLGVYQVVTTLADRGPVLILVDDAHHLDAATSSVLAFVISRLTCDPVATLLTVDGELPSPLADLALPTVELGPIPRDELEALIRSEGPIAPAALEQCCAIADGNPLIAIEVARSLDPRERDGRIPVSLLPKPPAALARRFAMRFDGLDDAAQRALVVAAADHTGRPQVVRAALAALGEAPDALERVEANGVIEIDGATVRFVHPVLQAIAYHRVAAPSRRAAHRALASVLSGPDDAAARAWQLADAADGDDENAAEALVLVAGDLARRGGAASAARVLERAAALSGSTAARLDRLLGAADAWMTAFEPDSARVALAHADLTERVDPDLLVGAAEVARWTDGPIAALDHVRATSESAGRALGVALEADLLFDTVGEAAAVEVASPLVEDPASDHDACDLAETVLARAGRAVVPLVPGPTPSGTGRLATLVARRRLQATAESGGEPAVTPARHDVETTVAIATAARHAGNVVGAYDRLVLERELVPERAALHRAVIDVALADVEQLLGRAEDAVGARLADALDVLVDRRARALGAGGSWVDGRIALDAGDLDAARVALETAAQSRPHLYMPELVVVHVTAGRPSEAERCLSALVAADAGALASVRIDRARAAVRNDVELFVRAAVHADEAALPIEACETRLADAEHLARDGRHDECRALAEQARAELARMGIRGWAGRLNRLLETATPAGEIASELTSAEYRVALAVADGVTNREAAAQLFLSVKTVDFHLQNIYRKLGLRSRTELAVRLSRSTAS